MNDRRSRGDTEPWGDEAISLIFYGGPVLTVRDEQPEVEAIAIRDGRIVALGDRTDVFRFHTARTSMIDLRGRALIPGFVDSHVHLAWSAFTKYRWVNVSPPVIRNRQELVAALRAAASLKRIEEWVVAYGYDPSWQSPDEPPLTATELDQASTSNPIFVVEQSGDLAYVNHKALKLAGSAGHMTELAVSGYVRDPGGILTGELRGASSFNAFFEIFPETTFEENLGDCMKMVRSWARRGCTTIYDAAVGGLWGQEEIRLFLELASDPTTPMRFRAALVPSDDLPVIAGVKPGQGNDRLSFVGIKFWADGFTPGVTGVIGQPLLAGIDDGTLNYDGDDLLFRMREWHNAGWQILVHANGQRAIEQVLHVFEVMLYESPRRNHRHRIEHCMVASDRQLARAKQMGVSVSHSMGHVYYCGDALRDHLPGGERERRVAPLASDFALDLVVSLHSDAPATPVEPLRYLQTAVTGITRDGQEILGPEQRITIDQALKAMTLYPAYQCFLEDKIGSLEVGKLADLVILDRNPRTVDPSEIGNIEVLETYIGGVMQSWT